MKIRIIAKGIWGANGEIPVGAEFTISGDVPPGWAERVEVIEEAPADAAPITNPRRRRG